MEEYARNKDETDKSIDIDVIETSDHDEEQFVYNPRKGAKTLENNLMYSGSNTLQGNEIYKMRMKSTNQVKVRLQELKKKQTSQLILRSQKS